MEKILESIWMVAVLVAGWFGARLTKQIDDLSKEKADAGSVREEQVAHSKLIHELDRRVDTVKHTLVAREEYKADVSALHNRLNELEKSKASRIQAIRVLKDDDKKESGNN